MNAAVLRRSSARDRAVRGGDQRAHGHAGLREVLALVLGDLRLRVALQIGDSALQLVPQRHDGVVLLVCRCMRACIHASISSPARTPVVSVTVRWSLVNPASASSPWAGRIAASATSSRSASSSESPAASSGPPPSRCADLDGGRRLRQRAGHRVDLAALQRHRPAAGRAPRRERVDPALGQRGAVDDGVAEEVARHPQREHEAAAAVARRWASTSASGAHPASRAVDPCRPVRGRARRRRAGGRRCSRSRSAAAGRAAAPGRAARGCGWWWGRRGAVSVRSSSAAVSVMKDSGAPL